MVQLFREPLQWLEALARWAPGGLGRRLRALWLKASLKSLGARPDIAEGIEVTGGDNIEIGKRFAMMRLGSLYAHDGAIRIGDRVSANSNVHIGAADGGLISIGHDVLIGPNTVLRASNHTTAAKDRPINRQGHTGGKIVIEDDVWLGANVVVVPDVTIGAHSVVAAGAVVTRDVEPWTIVAGVPAKPIAKR